MTVTDLRDTVTFMSHPNGLGYLWMSNGRSTSIENVTRDVSLPQKTILLSRQEPDPVQLAVDLPA
jgi:hypothetical protein